MRFFKTSLYIFLIGTLVLFLFTTVPAYRRGSRILSVQSNSMEPAFAPGDGVIMEPTTASELEYNDIVSYRSASDPRVIISHRYVKFDAETGMLYTKGDNIAIVDQPFAASYVVGKVTGVIPRAGYVLDVLQTPVGIIVAVYLPGGLILIAEGKRLARRFARPAYQLHGYDHLKHGRV